MKFFTLENKNGLKLKVTNYGATVSEIHVPDRNGQMSDIALGFDTIEEYCDHNDAYFGATIGRYGNRIGACRFSLDGKEYGSLFPNDGANHLHGGEVGFDKVVWGAEQVSGDGYVGLKLTHLSKDGEEGYPGALEATVLYKLTDANEWIIEYEATTTAATVFNPTNHTYFNLAGHATLSPMTQMLQLNASHFTVMDDSGIPTGEIRSVAGTPLDFGIEKAIGKDVDSADPLIVSRGGYDHNFVIDKAANELALAAIAWDPDSGREMKVFTTEPGIQLYTGNFLDGSLVGKGGYAYPQRGAFCLETQHFPNSPNIASFPTTVLRPGEVFRSRTVHAFGIRNTP